MRSCSAGHSSGCHRTSIQPKNPCALPSCRRRVIPEPGEFQFGSQVSRFLAPILRPLDIRLPSQDAGAFLPPLRISAFMNGANIEPHTIVNVGVPTDRLVVERFPPDENVKGWLSSEDLLELILKSQRCSKEAICTFLAILLVRSLPVDPATQVRVGNGFQRPPSFTAGTGQLMSVHETVESILVAVPDMPDERGAGGTACSAVRRSDYATSRQGSGCPPLQAIS